MTCVMCSDEMQAGPCFGPGRCWADVERIEKKAPLTTMNLGVHRIASDPLWRTPGKVFATLDTEFRFTLDPCASAPIRHDIEWFGESDQGLWREWSGRVFVNPPYGRAIADWMRKILIERERCEVIVGLIPARTDTEWWHETVMRADEVRFIRGRLSFEGVDAPKGHNAPFPSVIVVWWNGIASRVVKARRGNGVTTPVTTPAPRDIRRPA